MSNRLLNLAWEVKGLTAAEKFVLVRLADHAGKEDDMCWPSHKGIAESCGITERSVRDILPVLERAGHITIHRETFRASRGQSAFTYKVHPRTPEGISPVTQETSSAVTPEANATDTGNRRLPHRKQTAATPEIRSKPIYNPQEPSRNHKGEPGTTPIFAPLKAGLFPREYEKLIADAEAEIKAVKDDPRNYFRDITDEAMGLIQFLRGEAKPGFEQRIAEIESKESSFERKELKTTAKETVAAWRERIKELKAAKAGRTA